MVELADRVVAGMFVDRSGWRLATRRLAVIAAAASVAAVGLAAAGWWLLAAVFVPPALFAALAVRSSPERAGRAVFVADCARLTGELRRFRAVSWPDVELPVRHQLIVRRLVAGLDRVEFRDGPEFVSDLELRVAGLSAVVDRQRCRATLDACGAVHVPVGVSPVSWFDAVTTSLVGRMPADRLMSKLAGRELAALSGTFDLVAAVAAASGRELRLDAAAWQVARRCDLSVFDELVSLAPHWDGPLADMFELALELSVSSRPAFV